MIQDLNTTPSISSNVGTTSTKECYLDYYINGDRCGGQNGQCHPNGAMTLLPRGDNILKLVTFKYNSRIIG